MKNLVERFKPEIKEMMRLSGTVHHNREITPENVFQEANLVNRDIMRGIVAGLMQPGSRIEGGEHLLKMGELADAGKRCLILSAHISNMDVPELWYLLEQAGPEYARIFEKLVFIAGRKLNEDHLAVKMFTEMYTRIVITPKSTFEGLADSAEKVRLAREAQSINLAAHRAVKRVSAEGRILLVYPSGTRYRPWDPDTGRGLREAEGYLRVFDYFCLGATKGNLLPPRASGMHEECPVEDRVVMRFSPVYSAADFREECRREASALGGTPAADVKQFTIDRVMEMIAALTKEID